MVEPDYLLEDYYQITERRGFLWSTRYDVFQLERCPMTGNTGWRRVAVKRDLEDAKDVIRKRRNPRRRLPPKNQTVVLDELREGRIE